MTVAEQEEQGSVAEEMNALRHLFIFHEESGVCLFYHPFTDVKIDPNLVARLNAGALSVGGSKGLSKKKPTLDRKELVYLEYRMMREYEKPCFFDMLITGQSSAVLSGKFSEFIKLFMKQHGKDLKKWKGNVRIFEDVDQIMASVFGVTKVEAGDAEQTQAE